MIASSNVWNKVYWFSRMLINSDKYGAIGKSNTLMLKIANQLKLNDTLTDEADRLERQKKLLTSIVLSQFRRATKKKERIEKLLADLDLEIQTPEDMQALLLTCEHFMVAINDALAHIPSDDIQFTKEFARNLLQQKDKEGLAIVVKYWDDLGVKGCLNAERDEIVKAFATLRVLMSEKYGLTETDKDVVLTAFVQEFERRVGQKRKSRAGGSLEAVTSFILNFYGIKTISQPEHFQADIEVDNWIRGKDGWLIAISNKRTLRERWKQVSSADSATLGRYKIKFLFHVITYDEDLSDDKITSLGSQRHRFYLPDNSRILRRATTHVGLSEYVRPMSQFVDDILQEMS